MRTALFISAMYVGDAIMRSHNTIPYDKAVCAMYLIFLICFIIMDLTERRKANEVPSGKKLD